MSERRLDWRPRLRPVDVQAARANGEQVYCLRDRLDPEAPTLVVSPQALLLLSLFDGTRDLRGVQIAFALRTGQTLPLDQIAAIAEQLDAAYLLEGPRYAAREAAQRAAFAALPRRPAVHAGGAYAGEPAALEAALDGYFVADGGPGRPAPDGPRRELVGLIAPHVDLHRGGPTYAWAYRALAEAVAPELVVLLGTCHAPMATAFAATTKDYDTPFGPLPTDAAFVRELAARYQGPGGADGVPPLLVEEYAHRAEHALEFQAVYLRYLQRKGWLGEVHVVPILCGAPHELVAPGRSPRDVPAIRELLDLLAAQLAADGRRWCAIAAADLAHVGPQYGDPQRLYPRWLAEVDAADRAMLERAAAGDAEGFYHAVMADGDRRRICGVAPIYALLRLLAGARGEVLRYTQWADPAGEAAVTFASVAFWRSAAPR